MHHRVPLHAESCQLKLGVLTLPRGDNKKIGVMQLNKFLILYKQSPEMKFRTVVLSIGFLLLMLALPVLAETVEGESEVNWFTLTM